MTYTFGKTIVINLGGSVIVPDDINIKLLTRWREFVQKYAKKHRFIIVVGGGRLARKYQESARAVRAIANRESDSLGIYATKLNAKLVQTVFGKRAGGELIDGPEKMKPLSAPVTVACGWVPGASTDYISAQIAAHYGAPEVVMAGKPAYVFSKNPDQFVDARPYLTLTWGEYWNLIPHKWEPGVNVPIDPVCAKYSRANKLAAIVVDGRNINNLQYLLSGEEFEGTIVR